MRIFISALFIASLLSACSESELPSRTIVGEAQGTTYTITTVGSTLDYSQEVDSILNRLDQDLSLWVDESLINQINAFDREDTVFSFHDTLGIFSLLYDVSLDVFQKTDGAFDPTVYPLVKAWGFGLDNKETMTQGKVDSILQFVGFRPSVIDMIELEENYIYQRTDIRKGMGQAMIDFNAIAQGYSVDLLADFLESKGVVNYMVELGGELKCKGTNPKGELWRIAVDKPQDSPEREFQAILTLDNKAVATSGSYRKYYEEDGKKYSHCIDPRTGYPVEHNLLSATVVANSCGIADAYATAFMVMGVEETARFIAANPDLNLEVYLLYDDGEKIQPVISEGMRRMIEEVES